MAKVVKLGLILLVGFVWACQPGGGSGVVARVNGEAITLNDVEQVLEEFDLSGPAGREVVRNILNELIDQRLILQEAGRLGLEVSPEELAQAEAQLKSENQTDGLEARSPANAKGDSDWRRGLERRLLIEKTLAAQVEKEVNVAPEEIDRLLAEMEQTRSGERIKLSQIMCEDKADAEQARQELKAGQPFEEVAARHSLLAGQAGETTSYLERDDLPPELKDPLWPLKKGQISPVLQGTHGWHVFLVLDRRQDPGPNRESAAERLKRRRRIEVQAAWLNDLRRQAKIELYPERLVDILSPYAKEEK